MQDRLALHHEIATLREECDGLREQLRQVRELLAHSPAPLPGLTPTENAIVAMLIERQFVRTETLLTIPGRDGEYMSDGCLRVHITRIRKKLGITIHSTWGQGYQLAPQSRVMLKQKMEKLCDDFSPRQEGLSRAVG